MGLGWLSVLLLVISLGSRCFNHLCLLSEISEDMTDRKYFSRIALWTSAARSALQLAQYTSSRDINVLQALCLLLHDGADSPHANTALLRIAITNAQFMGLDKLQKIPDGSPRDLTVRHEIAKRIWWYISFHEWLMDHQNERSGIMQMFMTPLPGNYDDEDLQFDAISKAKDHSHHTDMTFVLACTKLAMLSRQRSTNTLDHSTPNIQEKHDAYSRVLSDFPSLSKASWQQNLKKSMNCSDRMLHIQRLLFERFALSVQLDHHRDQKCAICVDIAGRIIQLQRRLKISHCGHGLTLFNVDAIYSAGLTLLANLEAGTTENDFRRITTRGEVIEACEMLEELETLSHHSSSLRETAHGCSSTLRGLLQQDEMGFQISKGT